MTDERRAEIIEQYKKRGNIKDAALFARAATTTVREVVREAGLLKRRGRQPVAMPPRAELDRLFKKFGTRKAVADVIGVNATTLKSHIERLGIQRLRAR